MRKHLLLLTLASLVGVTAFAEPPDGKEPFALRKAIEARREHNANVVTALMYSPDDKILAAASLNGTVRLFDTEATKVLYTLKTSSLEVYAIAISPDGKYLASGGTWPEIQIWEIASGRELRVLKGHGDVVAALKFSPDGKLLASGSYDKRIFLWDTSTWTRKAEITRELDRVTSLSFSPDGKVLASAGAALAQYHKRSRAGQADVIRLWDVATGKLERALTVRGTQVDFSPDGRSLMASGLVLRPDGDPAENSLCGWDSIQWILLGTPAVFLDTTEKGVGAVVAHSASWRWYATTSGYIKFEHLADNVISCDQPSPLSVQIWESATRQMAAGIQSHHQETGDYETITAFSSDDKHLAIGNHGGAVFVRSLVPDSKNSIQPNTNTSLPTPNDTWSCLATNSAGMEYALEPRWRSAPAETVKLLAEKLNPASLGQIALLKQKVLELDDATFAVRQNAISDLRRLAWRMLPALQEALAHNPSAEARNRLQALLQELASSQPPPEYVRYSRAVGLLERIGTPEARAVLKSLAHGTEGAAITEMARLALARLGL